MNNARLYAFLSAVALGASMAAAACGDAVPSDTTSTSSGAGGGSTTTGSTSTSTSSSASGTGGAGGGGTTTSSSTATGAGGGGGAPDCYMNPMTHVEIINACTTADRVDKMPILPLLGPNGQLPPLP